MEFKKAFFSGVRYNLWSNEQLLFAKVIGFVIKMKIIYQKTWNNEYHKYS